MTLAVAGVHLVLAVVGACKAMWTKAIFTPLISSDFISFELNHGQGPLDDCCERCFKVVRIFSLLLPCRAYSTSVTSVRPSVRL